MRGSPPPMRGKGPLEASPVDTCRITPAHAGKSEGRRNSWRLTKDHPRPCGEKVKAFWRIFAKKGSPPPMRGKVAIGYQSVVLARITPAHAGKSYSRDFSYPVNQDHPRPCGEKIFFSISSFLHSGSPPPMRGKAQPERGQRQQRRITPAHAGKSLSFSGWIVSCQDHPRPCGEK